MKLKRFIAAAVSFIMTLSVIPAAAAETTTLTESLVGEVVWSAPTVGGLYDAPVASHWSGWSSSGDFANIRTYDGYDVLQFYSAGSTNLAAAVTASDEVKEASRNGDMLVIEWKHKWQEGANDCYYNFTFRDADGVEITTFTLDKNVTSVTDTHKLGFPSNYTDMALVIYNNADGKTHSVEYYVAGIKVYTDSALSGTVSGFGSIEGSDGWWTSYAHIGFADLTISTVSDSETTVEVVAEYTANGNTVKTAKKRYDTANGETSADFNALSYSANGENVLYHTDGASLSESGTIEMEEVKNYSPLAIGSIIAHDGKQYTTLSENLIPNADFAYGLAGWYSGNNASADEANFTVNANGSVTIAGNDGSESAKALYRAWQVESGETYFLTFTLDEAIEYARVTESLSPSSTIVSSTLRDQNSSVQGKNNIVFTASSDYVRVCFGWAQGRTLSAFALYKIEEAEEAVTETIKSVAAITPVNAIKGDVITLPATVMVEGSLGSISEGTITWNEPASYPDDETVTVNGAVTVTFMDGAEALTADVSVLVTVHTYDHKVETFWHAGNDSNTANFGMYNYLGNYNGGVIVAEATFSTTEGTNKLIMYGNSSSNSFGGTGALVRFMQADSTTPFEYYDGEKADWVKSDIIPAYNTEYTLRTTIDITNKTYTLEISAEGGEFKAITPSPMAFRNGSLTSIDRMIYSGSMDITSHVTSWISGYSYLNVKYVNSSGDEIRTGYRVKAATNVEYTDDAPKLIEHGDDLYILENVDTVPSKVVAEGEDTLLVSYNKVTMVEFESPTVNHVRGDKAINMPTQVKMVFSDGQKILYPVTWDLSAVDTDSLGEYEVTGTIDGIDMTATATVKVRDVEIREKSTTNTVATNNGGWNWYVEPSGTHIQPGDSLATRYESGQYSSNNGYTFTEDKTYMGWVEDEGTIVVAEYNHKTDEYKRVVVHEFLEADDHNNPAVVVLPDGRIMVFYSKHTTENRMYYCVTKNPEDISEWHDWDYYYCYTAPENTTYNATYPSVFIVHDDEGIEGNDVIYVGWRGVHWKPTLAKFSIPDENGKIKTIMGQTQFANTAKDAGDFADGGRNDGRRPYTKYDYDFDRNKIYMTFTTHHPDNDSHNNIYYVYLDIASQNLYTANDAYLQPLPEENSAEYASQGALGTNGQWGVVVNDLTDNYPELLLFDANEQTVNGGERRGWTWDIKVNEKGEPCVVYADITATPPNPDGSLPTQYIPESNGNTRSHHYYWYARWDSDTKQWVKTFLSYGGKWWHENATQERCYSGGLTFDHNAADANVIYLSIPTMGTYGNIFEIFRWESDDHGATWTIREPITENSKINNVRPNAIYNYKVDEDGNHQGPRLLWKSGEYRYWMNYEYKTGIWTDFAADGFITQDDPEMFADAALYANGEKTDILPTGDVTLTGKFNITNISIGDGSVLLALAHYNSDGALVKVTTKNADIPARSVPQIGMIGAPKFEDGSLSPMGTEEIVEEIEYTATISEGDSVKLLAWNTGIEHPMSSIISVPFETSTQANKYLFVDTFTYDGTEKLVLDGNEETYNGWVAQSYNGWVDYWDEEAEKTVSLPDQGNDSMGTRNYAAVTKAPFGNTGLHVYHTPDGGDTGWGGIMVSHALPDTDGKDYTIKFSMRYIDEMSWNYTSNSGFTLSHGVPVFNDGDATPCALQFRHRSDWGHYNGRGTSGYVRPTRWFDGGSMSWIFSNGIYSEQGRGNEYDALMTGSNYEVTINVSPANKTIDFSIYDGHRTVYHSTEYVDADSFAWDSNPIDTITFSIARDINPMWDNGNLEGEMYGEIYIDDFSVELAE